MIRKLLCPLGFRKWKTNSKDCYVPAYVFEPLFRPNRNYPKYEFRPIYFNDPWRQAEIEVDRISKEFMQELADAINKEVERQIKKKEKAKRNE